MAKTTVPCSCGEPIARGDAFCQACGKEVDADTRARLVEALDRLAAQAADDDRAMVLRTKVRKAANMIAILGVLFLVSGAIFYAIQKGQADKAIAMLAGMPDDATFPTPIDGVTYKVGALRAKVAAEPVQLLVVNVVLASLMGGLYLWARKSPLPAIITAFALFFVVHFVNFLLDPATIVQGIIIKVLAIAAFVAGIKAALEVRAASAPPASTA
ncbi:MAG: zinc ribbon domain-containing protein [Myxococcales bacterium]|nr:zinc ribbon domain-containing protein [Myxococcales bacterium]